MNNFNNYVVKDKINSQLEKAEIQKSRLISNIYKEYEHYLNLVRDILYSSVEKGVNELCSYRSIKDNFLNAKELYYIFEKKISKIINDKLPFITVEQLKITKIEKRLKKEINLNNLGSSPKIKNYQKEKFQYEDDSNFEEPLQFKVSEDISYISQYYQVENYDKLVSLDLDKKDHKNYLSNNNIAENIELEKEFISSLLELVEEVKVEKSRNSENDNINKMDISIKHKSIKNFDLIDKSLENLLLNLSYKINQ